MSTTAAQDEFNELIAKNTVREILHPDDRNDPDLRQHQDTTEEDDFRQGQIAEAMRAPTADLPMIRLPPASFDDGHTTGVKGVIADARSYENARTKSKWRNRVHAARRSIFGLDGMAQQNTIHKDRSDSESDEDARSDSDRGDEDSFLSQWREHRRRELEAETDKVIRNRRTSPSVREYGRFDEVDALGYLDAIEKCEVSKEIESALVPLVKEHRAIHFVKVHYDEIEFDPAAVPSILAYRNQGDLFANLTGVIEMIPEDEDFTSDSLKRLFQRFDVL
ncbi:Phosducin-like protein [Emericellopsis cladophorae]|uniref:Phosducin-like protein n=1 Tax=Emericellopsis cladophorae TaxID=2686198 RepID=A0A9Q0BHT2_9HYPO|nr:Phosducin-like protein [Emericellopsis cladophorae]KAI6784774.1 Phosducin-like protein [Emericellopsis cladophorae]